MGSRGRASPTPLNRPAYRLVRDGGRVAVVSSFGEYNRLAAAFDGSQIIRCWDRKDATDAAGGGISLDPQRQEHPGPAATERLGRALALLAGEPESAARCLLGVLPRSAGPGGAARVLAALERETRSQWAEPRDAETSNLLRGRLTAVVENRTAPFLFDQDRPPLRHDSPLLVFDLKHLGLRGSRGPETPDGLAASALLYLVMSAALDFCEGSRAPSAVLVDDTAWQLVHARPAWDLLLARVRHSEYSGTAVWLVAQSLYSLGLDLPYLDSYLAERLLFNTRPTRGADNSVGLFFGTQTPTARQEAAVRRLQHRGECLWRSSDGKVKRVGITSVDVPPTKLGFSAFRRQKVTCTPPWCAVVKTGGRHVQSRPPTNSGQNPCLVRQEHVCEPSDAALTRKMCI